MYLVLLRLRLRWFSYVTARVLQRHWQGLLLVLLLLPAGLPPLVLLHGLALPVTALFTAHHDVVWHFAYLLVILGMTLMWVMLQRNAIHSTEFMVYVATLPVSLLLRRQVDLTLLVLANSILLFPMIIALALTAATGSLRFIIWHTFELLLVLIQVLVTQLAVLEKNKRALPWLLLMYLLFSVSLSLYYGRLAGVLMALSLVAAILSFGFSATPLRSLASRADTIDNQASLATVKAMNYGHLNPALRIQLQLIFLVYPVFTTVRVAFALALAGAANLLMRIFDYDHRTLPTALMTMAALAMICSGHYRLLDAAHAPMRNYEAALPLSCRYWPVRDTATVMLLGILPVFMLLSPLWLQHAIPVRLLVSLALAYLILLLLLRVPQLHGGRQSLLLSMLLASAWSGTAMAALL